MPQSNSKSLRSNIVASLAQYVGNNPFDYTAYMTACSVSWFYRDLPDGMSTIDQAKTTAIVHDQIDAICKARPEDEFLNAAHYYVHELRDLIVQRLKEKGLMSADDYGFSDDGTIAKHADDFSAWAAELNPDSNDEIDK